MRIYYIYTKIPQKTATLTVRMSRFLFSWLLMGGLACHGYGQGQSDPFAVSDSGRHVIDSHGAIVRGDVTKKQIALVFTGDEFADGGPSILNTLDSNDVLASFFLTGNFYQNKKFAGLIRNIRKAGHYLGPHSDKHLLYADWTKRDSLLVTEDEFREDLMSNYERMGSFGIAKKDAPYFLPPYEWHNRAIATWTRKLGLRLVNFSHGTRSNADYTYPAMGSRYVSSEEVYRSIIQYEQKDPHGLNGFILLVHIGTDPRRTDKFYNKLDQLLKELKLKGYEFVTIRKLLDN